MVENRRRRRGSYAGEDSGDGHGDGRAVHRVLWFLSAERDRGGDTVGRFTVAHLIIHLLLFHPNSIYCFKILITSSLDGLVQIELCSSFNHERLPSTYIRSQFCGLIS